MLPSFLSDKDLRAASGRLFAIEARELWSRLRVPVEQYGPSLGAGIDALLSGGVPDTSKLRHWCHVSKAILRGYALGLDPDPASVSHFVIDGLAPERLVQLHALRLVEAFLAAKLGRGEAAQAPFELRIDEVPAPTEWELGRAGALVAHGAGRGFILRLDGDGLTIDEGGRLVEERTPDGARLRFDERYRWSPPLVLTGPYKMSLPIHDRGLSEPYAASAPVVRDRAVCAAWMTVLGRACALAAGADAQLLDESLQYVNEALPLYHGLGQRFASASNVDVLGYVYLPAIPTELDVAECLIHEAMHQKLFRLEAAVHLFAPDSPVEETFYSPWRNDPRPLRMVLHGCYVFTFVVNLWLRWAELAPRELIAERAPQEIAFQRGVEVLAGIALLKQYAKLTRAGTALVEEVHATCRGLLERTTVSDAARARVNAELAAHRARHLGKSRCSEPITF